LIESLQAQLHLIDLILLLVAAEALLVWWVLRRRSPRGRALTVQLTLASGACLLLAVRAALADSTQGLLLSLTAGFAVHLAYMALTLRRDG